MTILLVRHGSAGDPYRWSGDDVDRPLDAAGKIQALGLDATVSEMGQRVVRVLSSRATRCLQTVLPLGERHGIHTEEEDDLFEGAAERTTRLVRDLAGTAGDETITILCSHSDVIPEVIRDLATDGIGLSGGRGCAYASIWELTTTDGRIVHAHYLSTP